MSIKISKQQATSQQNQLQKYSLHHTYMFLGQILNALLTKTLKVSLGFVTVEVLFDSPSVWGDTQYRDKAVSDAVLLLHRVLV